MLEFLPLDRRRESPVNPAAAYAQRTRVSRLCGNDRQRDRIVLVVLNRERESVQSHDSVLVIVFSFDMTASLERGDRRAGLTTISAGRRQPNCTTCLGASAVDAGPVVWIEVNGRWVRPR